MGDGEHHLEAAEKGEIPHASRDGKQRFEESSLAGNNGILPESIPDRAEPLTQENANAQEVVLEVIPIPSRAETVAGLQEGLAATGKQGQSPLPVDAQAGREQGATPPATSEAV